MPHSSHLLVRAHGLHLSAEQVQAWNRALPLAIAQLQVFHAKDQALTYLRLHPKADAPFTAPFTAQDAAAWVAAAEAAAPALAAESVEVAWLASTLARPGASYAANAITAWHYVVETDATPQAEDDFNQWYDTEHLPGLAAVPGVQWAERFHSSAKSPLYHASYDLHSLDTFGSPAWLAVRATAWSDRVRPEFRNTRRTMFAHIASLPFPVA